MPHTQIPWTTLTDDRMEKPHEARKLLSRLLRAKQLVLLLGAGASKDLGLPSWSELVQSCADALGDDTDLSQVTSAADLMTAIDKLRRKHNVLEPDMLKLVRSALYGPRAGQANPVHPFDAFKYPLLSALGALMMSSARGSAGEVFTLNFDDVLEWYLHLHGFRTEVVAELPKTIRGDVDVHVYHLHGFVPLVEKRYPPSSWIVFSQSELNNRLAKEASYPWEALLLNRLQSKVFLAIGTSMSDTDINASLVRARTTVLDRPLGFVLGRHDADKTLELRENGLVPVHFDDVGDIPTFLFEVCQQAAALT